MNNATIILYDADCGICQYTRGLGERRDRHHRLDFRAFQHVDLSQIAPGVTFQMASQQIYAITPDGTQYAGARAFFEAMRHLSGLIGIFGRVMCWRPLTWIAEPVYQWVARNRYNISARLGLAQCKVPDSPAN